MNRLGNISGLLRFGATSKHDDEGVAPLRKYMRQPGPKCSGDTGANRSNVAKIAKGGLLQPGPQADDGRLVLQALDPSVKCRVGLDRYHAFTVTNRLQVVNQGDGFTGSLPPGGQ